MAFVMKESTTVAKKFFQILFIRSIFDDYLCFTRSTWSFHVFWYRFWQSWCFIYRPIPEKRYYISKKIPGYTLAIQHLILIFAGFLLKSLFRSHFVYQFCSPWQFFFWLSPKLYHLRHWWYLWSASTCSSPWFSLLYQPGFGMAESFIFYCPLKFVDAMVLNPFSVMISVFVLNIHYRNPATHRFGWNGNNFERIQQ